MHRTNLRKVGGSVMLALPPAVLDLLDLKAGARVGVTVEGDHLVIAPEPRPRYSLADLLARCDPSAPLSSEDHAWTQAPPDGGELI